MSCDSGRLETRMNGFLEYSNLLLYDYEDLMPLDLRFHKRRDCNKLFY